MSKIKVIIVDDELQAREGLRSLLMPNEDIEIVGVCSDGMQAIEDINDKKPDLVFLDIQMPEINGFEVLNNIDQDPFVIFVTAYDQYALKAFENHALDYLVKPFSDERFEKALLRAKSLINRSGESQKEKLSELISDYIHTLQDDSSFKLIGRNVNNNLDRLIIKSMGKILFLDFKEVSNIEAYDYYINVYSNGKKHLVRESLKIILQRLPNNKFFRVSKSHIVNLDHIKSIEPTFSGNYSIELIGGKKIKLSKNYKDLLSFI